MKYIKRKDEDFLFPPKKRGKKSFSYILSTVSDTLQPSQGFFIQIQFSSCYHPPVPSSFTSIPPPLIFLILPSLLLSPLPRFTSGCHLLLPSRALSLGGDMKGYLCTDSQGRRRAELINLLSGADC